MQYTYVDEVNSNLVSYSCWQAKFIKFIQCRISDLLYLPVRDLEL